MNATEPTLSPVVARGSSAILQSSAKPSFPTGPAYPPKDNFEPAAPSADRRHTPPPIVDDERCRRAFEPVRLGRRRSWPRQQLPPKARGRQHTPVVTLHGRRSVLPPLMVPVPDWSSCRAYAQRAVRHPIPRRIRPNFSFILERFVNPAKFGRPIRVYRLHRQSDKSYSRLRCASSQGEVPGIGAPDHRS